MYVDSLDNTAIEPAVPVIEEEPAAIAPVQTPEPAATRVHEPVIPAPVSENDTIAENDSIAADTIAVITVPAAEKVAPPPPPAWTTGLEPAPLARRADADPVLSASIVILLLVMMMCIRHSRRLIPAMIKDLLSVRTRKKSFDEHTANESRVIILFGIQFTVFAGILLSAGADIATGHPPLTDTAMTLLPTLTLCGIYYIFQICAYWTVGFAFATSTGRRLWLRGFNASQSLLGFAMAIPALLVVFYPDAADGALTTAATFYVFARLIFIFKGLRIFYQNFYSLLYFILYLCTLEIIPLIVVFKTAIALNG